MSRSGVSSPFMLFSRPVNAAFSSGLANERCSGCLIEAKTYQISQTLIGCLQQLIDALTNARDLRPQLRGGYGLQQLAECEAKASRLPRDLKRNDAWYE